MSSLAPRSPNLKLIYNLELASNSQQAVPLEVKVIFKMIDVALLIELIQHYSFLYNKRSKDFRDVGKKNNAWVEIAETLNCEVDEVKTRWRTLRERYAKEAKETRPTSGQSQAEVSTWEWFDALAFLDGHVKPRKTTSAGTSATVEAQAYTSWMSPAATSQASTSQASTSQIAQADSDEEHIDLDVEVVEPKPSKTVNNRRPTPRKSEVDLIETQILDGLRKLENNSQAKEDEDDIFCKALACELRKIKDVGKKQKIKAQMYLLATGLDGKELL